MLLSENLCLQTTADLRQLAENCLRGQEYFQEQGPEAIAKNVRNGTAFYTLLTPYSREKSQNRVANERR
jgi:glycine cleavage system pyridoxal-binding protein P